LKASLEEGEPKRPKFPREPWPRSELNLRKRKEAQLTKRDKAVGAPATGWEVCWKSARTEEVLETRCSIAGWNKASQGEAQERWELKETSEDLES
jgi:hypothetical protein